MKHFIFGMYEHFPGYKKRELKWTDEETERKMRAVDAYTIQCAGSLNPRTIIANPPINPGERVMVDFKLKGLFHKIGITCDSERLNGAFTDQKSGWGYYLYKNELRHERNNRTYANIFPPELINKDENQVSLVFDRVNGVLSFLLNGILQPYSPISFKELEFLEEKPFWVAISMMFPNQTAELTYKRLPWVERQGLLFLGKNGQVFSDLPKPLLREIVEFL